VTDVSRTTLTVTGIVGLILQHDTSAFSSASNWSRPAQAPEAKSQAQDNQEPHCNVTVAVIHQ
jgi:hypothetical protein